jgi:hypothetical protein
MRETMFTNGSKIEVFGSTPEAVNGPHPQKAHADEIELMRDDTWRESRNMTISKTLKDGRVIIPQDILTSTRKGPSGRVQQLIDEIEKAVSRATSRRASCTCGASRRRPSRSELPRRAARSARSLQVSLPDKIKQGRVGGRLAAHARSGLQRRLPQVAWLAAIPTSSSTSPRTIGTPSRSSSSVQGPR